MKQYFKSILSMMAIFLLSSLSVFAYENWESTHNSSYSSEEYTWNEVQIKNGQWVIFDWEYDGQGKHVNFSFGEKGSYASYISYWGSCDNKSGSYAYQVTSDKNVSFRVYSSFASEYQPTCLAV